MKKYSRIVLAGKTAPCIQDLRLEYKPFPYEKKYLHLLCGIYLAMAGIASPAIAQQLKLGNNPTQISKTALLELESTNQGLLLPRISDTNAFHPNPIPDGMLIFYVGTSDSCLMIRKDGVWIKIVDFANLASRETDPIATAKTVSVTAGYGLTGGGSNTLGNNPSFTLNVDTTKLATQNYVNNRYTSGFGVNVNNSTGVVSADTNKVTTTNYVNNRYKSGFGVNVNNSTGVVSADTTKMTTMNYVNNRYTGGTGISVNNSTGVITNTGVVTETDPIANAKSITVSAGYGLSGGGTNTLGNNPSFTLNVDTTKLATQNYVKNRYTSGFGVNVNNSTGVVSADTTKVTTMNYVNNRYTSGFGVNVNNSTGVVSADTSSGRLATQNYVNNRYTGGTGISVNNSTGVITNTGVVTETDPVANAKSVSVTAGYGLTGGGSNTLGNNPSFTLNVDTTKLSTQNYVKNRYTSGFGVNVNNSTGVVSADTSSGKLATQNYVNNRYTGGTGISVNNSTGVITNTGVVTETDPVANAKSVSVTAGYGLTGGGSNTLGNNPSFTLNVDTTKVTTRNYVNNRYTSGYGVNVNNSTGVVSADTSKITTINYVNNRYTSGFGVNVNNSTGIVSADTTKVTTTNYVNNRYTSGFGVNVNNSTGVITADTTSGKLATQNYVNNKFSGTPNYLAVFTGSNSLGNSIVQQPDIHNLFVNGTLHLASGNIDVNGTGNFTGSLTLGSALIASGSAGTTGQVLVSQGAGNAPQWQNPSTALNAWSLTGNAGTTPGTNFLGTTDNQDLVFKTNNTEQMRITNAGKVGIGTSNPQANLDVNGNFKLGTNGTVFQNMFHIAYTTKSDISISGNIKFLSPVPVTTPVNINVPNVNQNATVIVNPRSSLPNNVWIGWVAATLNGQITICFINGSGNNQTIPSGTIFDILIIQ